MRTTSLLLSTVGLLLVPVSPMAASGEHPSDLELARSIASGGRAASRFEQILLTADAIEQYATNRNGTRLQRGIRRTNAFVVEPVSLRNIEFPYEFFLQHCDFYHEVDFSFARFQRRLALRGCVFRKHLSLESIHVEEDLDLTDSVFLEGISLEKATIKGRLLARGVGVVGPVELNQCQIKLAECRINLTADLGLQWMTNIDLAPGVFSTNEIVSKVLSSQGLKLGSVTNVKSLTLTNDQIPNSLPDYLWLIERAVSPPVFYAAWQKCYQSSNYTLEVFKQTAFLGAVDMSDVHCGSKLLLGSAQFLGPARFDGMKVEGSGFMAGARFFNFCSFGYAQFTEELDASQVQFSDCCHANFYALRANRVLFNHARFGNRAIFANATANVSFEANDASFGSSNEVVNFKNFKVGGTASFKGARFEGPVTFNLARIGGNLDAESAQFRCPVLANAPAADSPRVNVDFGGIKVDGLTILSKASFWGDVSLRNAQLQELYLDLPTNRADLFVPGARTNQLFLEGFSVKSIRAITNEPTQSPSDNLSQTWDHLSSLLRVHVPYSPDVYKAIEDYFRRDGQQELADEVYIESRQRERETISLTAGAWNRILYFLVRYGREPEWALGYSVLWLVLGVFVFNPGNMKAKQETEKEPNSPDATETETESSSSWTGLALAALRAILPFSRRSNKSVYNPLMYSLDLFLPLSPFAHAKRWGPREDCRWISLYKSFHVAAGLVLTPSFLGSIGLSEVLKALQ